MNTTTKDSKELNAFTEKFIKHINSDIPIQQRIVQALQMMRDFFGFKRAFVYQTDGFRYFYLKESFGNEDNTLRNRFEIKEMTKEHTSQMGTPFYGWRDENVKPVELDILNFYHVDSLILRQFKDIDGKIIGFVGYAESPYHDQFNTEEIDRIQMLTGLLSKEITIREYKEKGIRTGRTLESIMNNMGVDIYVNDFDNHDMLYVNESMAAPYGGIEHFANKKCWQALYTDKTGECEFCPKKHLIDEKGHPSKVYSWDYQRPFDGSWFRVFSAAFGWTDGQLAQVITSVDITHQKQIEEELRLAKEKAENLDLLKSAFLANMSHEIRTPLNAIVGFSDMLAITDDPEEKREYNEIVQENNRLLLQLISDILDLSKIESGTLDFETDSINVNDFCNGIVKAYQVNQNAKVPIVFDRSSMPYTIHTDKNRLTQVVTNFINNAIKFTTQGNITLSYRLLDDNMLEVSVTDTGIGIPPEKVGQVFDRFVKLNTFAKGTGLGLSICKSIIEYLGGQIGAESEVGKGSRFWFTHPLEIN